MIAKPTRFVYCTHWEVIPCKASHILKSLASNRMHRIPGPTNEARRSAAKPDDLDRPLARATQAEEAAQPGRGSPGKRASSVQRALSEKQLSVPIVHLLAHRGECWPFLGQAVELPQL